MQKHEYPAFEALAASRTDWTLQNIAQAWHEHSGVLLSPTTVLRTLRRIGFVYKKNVALQASETKQSEQNEAKRACFREQVKAVSKAVSVEDLVFLDETGVSLALFCPYGWVKKGQLLVEAVPTNRGKNLSVLGAFDKQGMICTTTRLGAMKRDDVEQFLQHDLLPRLLPGSVLVFDNATIHKGGKVKQLINEAGCHLLYLPAYSPDMNPIEHEPD